MQAQTAAGQGSSFTQLLSDGMSLQDSYNQFFNRTPVATGDASPSDYMYLVEDFIDTAMNYTTTSLSSYNSSLSTLVSAFSQLQTLESQKSSMGVSFVRGLEQFCIKQYCYSLEKGQESPCGLEHQATLLVTGIGLDVASTQISQSSQK